jgi:hypothetical protein
LATTQTKTLIHHSPCRTNQRTRIRAGERADRLLTAGYAPAHSSGERDNRTAKIGA